MIILFIHFVKQCAVSIITNYYWLKKLKFPLGKKVFFIGTPEYTNLGDSAITIAQTLFLEKCSYKKDHIIEFTQSEFKNDCFYIKRYIGRCHLICTIGGGNMGNQWYNEELFRYRVFESFPNNKIIVFPQTVFFTDDDKGRKAIEDSYSHYESYCNLTIVAREKQSYDMLRKLYHNPNTLLPPDIVLSTKMSDYGVTVKQRSGVLLVFRNDIEKSMSDDDRNEIIRYLDQKRIGYRMTDMYADEVVTKENRMTLVQKKMQEFADAELVITDRLHGMVFAAITETPCIVFSNNHHKVKGTYEWIKDLPYVRYVTSSEEAMRVFPDSLGMKNCQYDNSACLSYFSELEKEIKKYA